MAAVNMAGLIRFDELYMDRVWGGTKLSSVLAKPVPGGAKIGEAWIVSDHASAVSTVIDGPLKGRTLRELIETDAKSLLGLHAKPTPHGRFPLLLKLLDSADWLSIQVHPDDETAERLGEPDAGKTEMWYIVDADPGSQILCGMNPELAPGELVDFAASGEIKDQLTNIEVSAGDAVLVAAGHMHAIGGGILLAEIQQNSDLTYRVYDWGRNGDDGKPRQLHLDKAKEATHFGVDHAGIAKPLTVPFENGQRAIAGACRYFATERVDLEGTYKRDTKNASFHILLGLDGDLTASAAGEEGPVRRGEAILIPGCVPEFHVRGTGTFLEYYVPDLVKDVLEPLRRAGYSEAEVVRLGGDAVNSDLAIL